MNINKEQIEKLREFLQMHSRIAPGEPLSILSALESESSPHVVAEQWYGHKFKEVSRGKWVCDCGHKIIEQIDAPQQTTPLTEAKSLNVPEGWKLVPVVATPEMLAAAEMLATRIEDSTELVYQAEYQAMLTATPPLNTQDGVDERDAKIERLENAMHQIEAWAKAYPLAVFPEPDWVKAHEVLQAAGMTIDAISASNMRHVIIRVVEIARSNLSKNTRSDT